MSLGIKFLYVFSQFDFAVVATAFYLNFPRAAVHYHGNDSPDVSSVAAAARPPRWPCNQSGMQTQQHQPVYITIMWITMPLTALQNPSLVNVIPNAIETL